MVSEIQDFLLPIFSGNSQILAEHFKLTGKEFTGDDLDIEIWYKNSQWVKMIFYKDGSKIFLKRKYRYTTSTYSRHIIFIVHLKE